MNRDVDIERRCVVGIVPTGPVELDEVHPKLMSRDTASTPIFQEETEIDSTFYFNCLHRQYCLIRTSRQKDRTFS